MSAARLFKVVVALELQPEPSRLVSGDVNQFSYGLLVGRGNEDRPVSGSGTIGEDCQIYYSRHYQR